jgi:hypothetical protein
MGAQGSGGSQSSKPTWLDGQKGLATDWLSQILGPMAFGAPNAGMEQANNRSREGLNATLANQGLTGSGLAAKSASGLEQGLNMNAIQAMMQAGGALMSPVGQKSSSFNMGLGVDGGKMKIV